MTESEAKGFVQGKLDCMEKCDVFNREDKHRNNECDNCEYCYSQGNFGEQKEAFQMAIKALEKQEKIKVIGGIKMKLTDIMNHPLKELVEQCNITKVQPISDDNGNIKKFIVEYEPHDESGKYDNMNLGGH